MYSFLFQKTSQEAIERQQLSIKVNGTWTVIIGYADDRVLIADYMNDLELVGIYSRFMAINVNIKVTKFLIIIRKFVEFQHAKL